MDQSLIGADGISRSPSTNGGRLLGVPDHDRPDSEDGAAPPGEALAGGVLAGEARVAVEAVLGAPVTSSEVVWERAHVVRVTTADGRSAVVKQPRLSRGEQAVDPAQARAAFDAELAHLGHLQAAPRGIVPTLLGACEDPPLLVMEDLPAGRSVAQSLLGDDRGRAVADLEAFAVALGSLHAWSFDNPATAARDDGREGGLWRAGHLARAGVDGLADAAAILGVEVAAGYRAEAEALVDSVVDGGRWRGFVHNDCCPDNTLVAGDRFVLFDFETSGAASVLLDAAYLVAPFPTCWCWAPLPDDVVEGALGSYRAALVAGAGPGVLEGFDVALAAALGAWFLGWSSAISRNLDGEREWGTTGGRPRLVRWGRVFVERSERCEAWPEVRAVVAGVVAELERRWGSDLPAYPPFARPGERTVSAPDWFTAL